MIRYGGLLLFVLFSCQNRQVKTVPAVDTLQAKKEATVPVEAPELEEFYVDSARVGRKSLNKLELAKYRMGDSLYVVIKFFSKQNKRWVLKNEFQFDKDKYESCSPKLRDFNNDGLNDMTYVWATAARGANDNRRLFVYNKKDDQLVYIKNSDHYPNLHYNKYLNCIDAWRVYGGCMSEFLRLSGDSLVKFASVELYEGLTVSTYDQAGNETIIFQDSTVKGNLARYKNYKPVQEYGEKDFQ